MPMTGSRTGPAIASPGQSAHPNQTIGAYAVESVPVSGRDATAGAARSALAGARFDFIELMFLLDDDRRLHGVVRMTDLLAAAPDQGLATLVRGDWPVVPAECDREEAASLAIRADVPALAVIDRAGRFVGAVSGQRIMAILRDEHLEDLHHMAGILSQSQEAKNALHAPPLRRALFRLPWLLIGIVGSVAATALMASNEQRLAANIAVAFFIPAIVYLADAIGTQSEAVSVRGLSVTDGPLSRLLAGELATGMLIGMVLALIALPLTWAAFGDVRLATAVSLTLLVAGSAASGLGILLPWLFARAGLDPAHGSGPIGTVVQDVLSLAVYLALARAIVL
jgi:magnesium transporter